MAAGLIASLLPTALNVLPNLLSPGGRPSAPASSSQQDVTGLVRAAVGRAEAQFRSRMQEHSASTARVLDDYRRTIRDLNDRLSRANANTMQATLKAAQAQQQAAQAVAKSQSQPVVRQVEQSKDNTMLYVGGGLVVLLVLMQGR